MSNSVKDRSGVGRLPKAERRALGKALQAKRVATRRRKAMINRIVRIAFPVVIVAALIGVVWLAIKGESPAGTPEAQASAAASTEPTAAAPPSLPAGADPQLAIKPVVAAGTGDLTQLNVTTLIDGTGTKLTAGQSVTVNYVGVSYKDGKEFDSSWKSGQPFTFTLGGGKVIKGWDQGLVGVAIGSRVQLDIPGSLAYGDTTTDGSPSGPLRFVVDVLAAS